MTAANCENCSLERKVLSRDRNLRTACALDYPIDLACGSLGSGTINRPVSLREWFPSKWRTVRSCREKFDPVLVLSSISQNFLRMSSPEVTDTW